MKPYTSSLVPRYHPFLLLLAPSRVLPAPRLIAGPSLECKERQETAQSSSADYAAGDCASHWEKRPYSAIAHTAPILNQEHNHNRWYDLFSSV